MNIIGTIVTETPKSTAEDVKSTTVADETEQKATPVKDETKSEAE